MTWKSFAKPLAIRSPRRVVAPAVFYGLSLAVRFTSAAGEEVEIAPPSAQAAQPLVTIMTRSGSGLGYRDWDPKADQPIVFRHGWPPGSPLPRCGAP